MGVRWPVVVAAIAVAGCGQESESTRSNTATPSATRHVPEALTGDWTSTYSKKDARKAGPAFIPGKFTMRFTADGTWELYVPGADPRRSCLLQGECFSSEVKADAKTVTLGELESCVNPATYSYRLRGDKLTMKKLKEDCTDERPGLFVDRVWERE